MLYVWFFLPASISILVSEKLRKEKRKLSDLIVPYLGYTFIITAIMNTIINMTSNSKTPWYAESMFTFQFSMEYMWLSLIVALVLPCLTYAVSKAVQINILVKEKAVNDQKAIKNYKRKH